MRWVSSSAALGVAAVLVGCAEASPPQATDDAGSSGGHTAAEVLPCVCSLSYMWGYPDTITNECESLPYCGIPSPCPFVALEVPPQADPPTMTDADAARCVAEALRDKTPGRHALGVYESITKGYNVDIWVFDQGYAFGERHDWNDQANGYDFWGRHQLAPASHFEGCLGLIGDHKAMFECLLSWRGECEPAPRPECPNPH